MTKLPMPHNESQRLRALLDYEILDTTPESDFDDLVTMARELFDVPIVLISLIDRDRQWFKAKVGIDIEETTRDVSFCTHAVASGKMLVVEDSLLDERFKHNPYALANPPVRFYAGAPLMTPNGFALGTLCIIDHKTRKLTREQEKFLEILSRQVMTQLELRRVLRKSQEAYKDLHLLTKTVMEQQKTIQKQEKLAVIGEVAAGVAHEVNNPLAIISGRIEIAISLLQRSQDIEGSIKELRKVDVTLERMARIGKALNLISEDSSVQFENIEDIRRRFSQIMDEARSMS